MAGKSDVSPAIHNITFCGVTGAIFLCVTTALVLYSESFFTSGWTRNSTAGVVEFEGLWETCTYRPRHQESIPGWFITVQVLLTIGLFGVVVSFGLSVIYMTANRASKNLTLTCLTFVTFITVVFILIGVTVFGYHRAELSWSYGVAVVAAILTFLAGILTILQIRRSNVHLC